MNLMPNTNKKLLIFAFGVLLIGVLLLGYFLGWGTVFKNKDSSNKKNVGDDQQTENISQTIKNKTYQQLQKEEPNKYVSPNISDKEDKEKLNELVADREVKNYTVGFDGQLRPREVEIYVGDVVTWRNNSQQPFTVVGSDNWGSFKELVPGESFSQEFDFRGEYHYTLEEIGIEGSVNVSLP